MRSIVIKGSTLHIVKKNFKRFLIVLQTYGKRSEAFFNSFTQAKEIIDKSINNYKMGTIAKVEWNLNNKKIVYSKMKPKIHLSKQKRKSSTLLDFRINVLHEKKKFQNHLDCINKIKIKKIPRKIVKR